MTMIKQAILLAFALLIVVSAQSSSPSFSNTAAKPIPFPQSLIKAMAAREMRYHHYLWHNVREKWLLLNTTQQAELTKLGWKPARPGRKYDEKGVSSPITDNGSGEDFLYMHRQMIAKANQILAQNKEPFGKITGWKSIPAPGDKEYPVPAPYNITNNTGLTSYTNVRKTDDYYNKTIKPMEASLKDPKVLRNLTLSELGSRIEVTIHSWMHMRWSGTSSYGYRPNTKQTLPYFDKKWDNPAYNWMGDTYASHVNPIFWKLHGWVDDRIEDWRRAHGLSTIRWNSTWVGGPMSSMSNLLKKSGKTNLRGSAATEHMHDGMVADDTMEKVAAILGDGPEVSFGDPIKIPLDWLPKDN